jgi:hypothetical protein
VTPSAYGDSVELFGQLRDLSDDELISKIDQMSPNTGPGVQFFYEELHRRQMNRSSDRMETMTANIERLTLRMMVLTVVAVVCSAVSIAFALTQ